MAGREVQAHALRPERSAGARGAPRPQAASERSPGAAAQLAAVHRTLRRGPAVRLRTATAASAKPVVQRYTIRQDQSRLSENGSLLLEGRQALYAGETQFEQANGIGGDVDFEAGAPHAELPQLNLVTPRVRQGTDLADKSTAWNREEAEQRIREEAQLQVSKELFKKELIRKDYSDEQYAALTPEQRDDFEGDLQDQIEDFEIDFVYDVTREIDDRRIRAMEAYLAREAALQASTIALIDSDCGLAAESIAGFKPDTGVPTEVPEAGAVYKYSPSIEHRDEAEWDFHYATIIMTDGADHATMENAGAKRTELFGKLPYDRSWYFELYGTREGQSFAEKYAADFGDAS